MNVAVAANIGFKPVPGSADAKFGLERAGLS
jgi:hypothetical protein